jgi:hypothetical protein
MMHGIRNKGANKYSFIDKIKWIPLYKMQYLRYNNNTLFIIKMFTEPYVTM